MDWFFVVLGFFWAFLGISAVFFTKTIKKHYGIFIEGNHPKAMGALALLVGGLLISCGADYKLYILILLVGLTQIVKGIYLIFGTKQMVEGLIKWWLNSSIFIYRLWGIITLIMGLVLIATILV